MRWTGVFAAYCLLGVSYYTVHLSERVSVTIELEPTTNSSDFDQIFPYLDSIFLGTSFVFQRFWRTASNGPESYLELARDQTKILRFTMSSQGSQVVWHLWLRSLEGEFNSFRFENQAQLSPHLPFTENLFVKNSVSSFPEIVWFHRSAIECLVERPCAGILKKPNQELSISPSDSNLHVHHW